jgi:hypothetical protein
MSLILGLLGGMLGCTGPATPAASPGSGSPPPLVAPSLPQPTGPSSTIEVPPPIN